MHHPLQAETALSEMLEKNADALEALRSRPGGLPLKAPLESAAATTRLAAKRARALLLHPQATDAAIANLGEQIRKLERPAADLCAKRVLAAQHAAGVLGKLSLRLPDMVSCGRGGVRPGLETGWSRRPVGGHGGR